MSRPQSFTQSGCDPRMMQSCIVVSPNASTAKTRIGYAICTDEELEPNNPKELARARFIREIEERRRRWLKV